MAYETELSNLVTIGNAISALASPALVKAAIGLGLVHAETFSTDTNVIKFRKNGNVVAETLAESTAYTPSASSELTDSSITCTAVKAVVASKLSVEALRFGTSAASLERLAQEHGYALGRAFDAALLALFTGFSTGITATTVLTKDNLLDAAYNVRAGMKGAGGGKLVGVFDYKGVNEIRKELTSISASAFSNPSLLQLVEKIPEPSALAGEFAGIEIYETDGLGTSGGDDIGAVFHPEYAFCAGLGGDVKTAVQFLGGSGGFVYEISSHFFYDVKEWNDAAGCKVLSDT